MDQSIVWASVAIEYNILSKHIALFFFSYLVHKKKQIHTFSIQEQEIRHTHKKEEFGNTFDRSAHETSSVCFIH